MKNFLILFLLPFSMFGFSQNDTEKMKTTLDSISKEADMLYNYEKVAWNSTDLLMSDTKLKQKYGGYIIYHSNDTIFATFLDKEQRNKIAKYTYTTKNLSKPTQSNFDSESLSKNESDLLHIKLKIVDQLSDEKYNVGFPEGFNPNLVLFKDTNEYRLYIIMGTSKGNVIPFGNDYVFRADMQGTIVNWTKFHSRMIPTQTQIPNEGKVVSAIHSHLKSTPYITATDICTFRLYAELYGIKEFMVLSTALGVYFKYNIDTNTIEVTNP